MGLSLSSSFEGCHSGGQPSAGRQLLPQRASSPASPRVQHPGVPAPILFFLSRVSLRRFSGPQCHVRHLPLFPRGPRRSSLSAPSSRFTSSLVYAWKMFPSRERVPALSFLSPGFRLRRDVPFYGSLPAFACPSPPSLCRSERPRKRESASPSLPPWQNARRRARYLAKAHRQERPPSFLYMQAQQRVSIGV